MNVLQSIVRGRRGLVPVGVILTVALLAAAGRLARAEAPAQLASPSPSPIQPHWDPFLAELEQRAFDYFWEQADPATGLVPDRWPTPSVSSIAAVGFGLAAYPVAVERGWITRQEAVARTLATLRFFTGAPQAPKRKGVAGYRGFYYHFLDMSSGHRHKRVELSTVDTALLTAGALVCQSYFDGDGDEATIRALADELYRRVEWDWAAPRSPLIALGWRPESGFHRLDWQGYNEAMILYILALGSPTHPLPAEAWQTYTSSCRWGSFYGQGQVGFAPLFGHQYSHIFVDFRGIKDALSRQRGIDYFENSRRATLAQRAYAIANPLGFLGYGANVWGLTPCDGPGDMTVRVGDRRVRFFTYAARGASFTTVRDDGTVAPWAAAASLPFAPEVVIPALDEMYERYGSYLWSTYGFLDAFNPTFATTGRKPKTGRVVPGVGWFAGDYLGIDEGPIVLMIENYRSGLIWKLLEENRYVVRGLRRAGFTGGWLGQAP